MLREENTVTLNYVEVAGIRAPGTTVERLVSKNFVMPARTGLTVESRLEGYKNQLLKYTRSELTALPTEVIVTERIDDLWGKVYDHTFLDFATTSRPDRAEFIGLPDEELPYSTNGITAAGTLEYSTNGVSAAGPLLAHVDRKVLDVLESEVLYGICKVVITTTPHNGVRIDEQVLDSASGKLVPMRQEHFLSLIAPAAFDTNEFRNYAEVTKVSHNHWLKTTKRASGLSPSRSEAVPFVTQGSIEWPAVLENYEVLWFSNDNASEGYLRDWINDSPRDETFAHEPVLSYNMRAPHAGPVKVEVRKWFQITPPNAPVDQEMLSSETKVAGRRLRFTIPECLHKALFFEEYSFSLIRTDISLGFNTFYTWQFHQDARWNFEATRQTDWPPTVTRLKVEQVNGGYQCEERIYYRPTIFEPATMVVTSLPASEFWWRVNQ